jgi:hypothetical protein
MGEVCNPLLQFFQHYDESSSNESDIEDDTSVPANDEFTQIPPNIDTADQLFQSHGSLLAERPPAKHNKLSFQEYKCEKLSSVAIADVLKTMQESAYWCCKMLCYTWLTTSLILFCREEHLLIDKTKDRRDWVEKNLSEMESRWKNRAVYNYVITKPIIVAILRSK